MKFHGLWEDFPGKLKIRSDGTTTGTTVHVLAEDLNEVLLAAAVVRAIRFEPDGAVVAEIEFDGAAVDIAAAPPTDWRESGDQG